MSRAERGRHTLTDEEIAETLALSPVALRTLAETIAQNPHSTIEPPRERTDTPGRRALAGLGSAPRDGGIAAGLTFGATIGEGGMGIVRTATQESLARKVAVKTLRSEKRDERATLRLLREAWVTGSLEHPNIVPVYDLGLGADGTPLIVLKHIEGVEWASLIQDAEAVRSRFGATDLLEHNLRILVQVCHAVSLAHARGVLHRDLKPENVMIGNFGEVYLVDWGIAVSLREDPSGRLPHVEESADMAGTPVYMAPEMLGGPGGGLSERTDVYLLGAILYEILVGLPPHTAEGFRATVASILRSKPELPERVAPELVAIVTRAMQRDAAVRFASVDEFRKQVEWYLRHRGSLALSNDAFERLAEMRAIVAKGDASADDAGATRSRLYQRFAEARYGFRQAVAASDDNDAARGGMREVVALVVDFELARGAPDAAAAALADLEDPPADLVARIARAREGLAEGRRRIAELERIETEHDLSIGRRTRMTMFGLLGLIWTVTPEVLALRHPSAHENEPHWVMYAFTMIVVAVGTLIALWGRESLTKTLVNRRALATVMINFGAQFALEVGGRVAKMPFWSIIHLHVFLWFVVVTFVAVFLDRRFWPAAIGFLVAFGVIAAVPHAMWHAIAFGNFVLWVNGLVAWGRFGEDHNFLIGRLRQRFGTSRETPPRHQ